MTTKRVRRGTAIHNGARNTTHSLARRRKLFNKLRESAIKGAFGMSVLTFLAGAAGLDSNPVAGGIVIAVSFVAAALIYFQNEWEVE